MICRFCLEEGTEEDFIAPCNCDGSMKHVHTVCLEKWVETSKSKTCNVCNSKYNLLIVNINDLEEPPEPSRLEKCFEISTCIFIRLCVVCLVLIVFI